MDAKQMGVGLAGLAVGLILFGGVAGAQQLGTDQSDVLPSNEVNTPSGSVVEDDQLGEGITAPETVGTEEVAGAAGTVEAAQAAEAAPAGSLPITGGDVVGLAVIGAAAVGAGAVLVRRTRTRTA